MTSSFFATKKQFPGQNALDKRRDSNRRFGLQSSAYVLGGHELKQLVYVEAAEFLPFGNKKKEIKIRRITKTNSHFTFNRSHPMFFNKYDNVAICGFFKVAQS
jgi:hypothetical protein